MLRAFLGRSSNEVGPEQIVGDICTSGFDALDHFQFSTIAEWGMYSTLLPGVYNLLLGLVNIEAEVVVLIPCL